MINYKCLACEHECSVDTGSMFGKPVKCLVTGEDVEWVRVADIIGYKTKCIRCGYSINIWNWKKGDPLPIDIICSDCLNDEEREEFEKHAT